MKRNLITGGALGWAALIFLLSSQSGDSYSRFDDIAEVVPAADFLVHMGLYFVLAALVHAALRIYLPERKNLLAVDTVIFCLLYGVSDEFHQAFVPGRDASPIDLVADVLGASLAVTLWLAFDRFRRSRRSGRGDETGPGRDGEQDTKRG